MFCGYRGMGTVHTWLWDNPPFLPTFPPQKKSFPLYRGGFALDFPSAVCHLLPSVYVLKLICLHNCFKL